MSNPEQLGEVPEEYRGDGEESQSEEEQKPDNLHEELIQKEEKLARLKKAQEDLRKVMRTEANIPEDRTLFEDREQEIEAVAREIESIKNAIEAGNF